MSVDYLTLFRDRERTSTHQEGTAQTEKTNLHSLCSSPLVHKNAFAPHPAEAASRNSARAADDDRRYCTECRNLAQSSVCSIARPQIGALVSDRLFQLKLVPEFNGCDWWIPLIPFTNCFFGKVADVQYVGKVQEQLQRLEVNRRLFATDSTLANKLAVQEILREVEALKSEDIVYLEISYFASRSGLAPGQIPESLSVLREFTERKSADVFLADIVVSRSALAQAPLKHRPVTVEILHDALFVRGAAAIAVLKVANEFHSPQ